LALYDAKNRQIETEEHFQQLADREKGRISAELKRIKAEKASIAEHVWFLLT
jgi:UDP-glucose:O-linked fucose beta-1,3-glucosyltransferase